jgi:hypothetical protein
VVGEDELPGKSHYFIGNDPKKWHTNVLTYAKVRYRDVYPGVDVVYYGNHQQVEHDFIVSPMADPGAIRLAFQGAEQLSVDAQGDLVLATEHGEVRLRKPIIYQNVGNARREVAGGYMLDGNHVRFQVAPYDASQALVIDPILVYSTYLGGTGEEQGGGIAVDSSGHAYVTGETLSADFPTANPLQPTAGGSGDVFIAKLNAAGNDLEYATYLGGLGNDIGLGIAVDASGSAYVTGRTASRDFPTVNPLQPAFGGGSYHAFVAKVNPAGNSLVYSTYLGGDATDFAQSIAVDAVGNTYITGVTLSGFPTVNPIQGVFGGFVDAFVAKLNAAGDALVYSTYLGGNASDQGTGIAVDAGGSAHVSGVTASLNFPTAKPLQPTFGGVFDAFVAKLNAAGSDLVYSTYLGGSNYDFASGIAVDMLDNVYVTGLTFSTNFPTVNPLQPALRGLVNAFVVKVAAGGNALVYSTYFGGSGFDVGSGIAVDTFGNAYVTGRTDSPNLPVANAVQPTLGGSSDAFVVELNPVGNALVYSTYLGGRDFENMLGGAIAVDNGGAAYVTGDTSSADFPTANPSQPALRGFRDAFIAKIGSPRPTITSLSATPNVLWPPNHSMVPVSLAATASDSSDPAPVCEITSVESNEPVARDPDWVVTGPLTVNLRAERAGSGTGRVYTVTVTCTNASHLSATETVTVTVPHDQSR